MWRIIPNGRPAGVSRAWFLPPSVSRLKSGLALGSASFLWIMVGFFHYDTKLPDTPDAVQGFRVCSGIVVGILFGICTVLLASYQLNKRMTIQMADELAERRRKHASENPVTA